MKLIAYLVPDDFEDWKMPQGIELSYEKTRVPGGHLRDMGLWLALGHDLALTFWRKLGGGDRI